MFTGKYQVWQDCGGTANDVVTLAATPADGSYMAVMLAQIVTDADLAALDQALRHLQRARRDPFRLGSGRRCPVEGARDPSEDDLEHVGRRGEVQP